MKNDKIIIYGAGRTGKRLYQHLKNFNISVEGFIDRNGDGSLFGLPIYNFPSIPPEWRSRKTILALHNEVLHVAEWLRMLNFEHVYSLAAMNLEIEEEGIDPFVYALLNSKKLLSLEKIDKLKSILEDECSQEIVNYYCNYIETGELKYLRKKDLGEMYHSDNRPYSFHTAFNYVDCGAFTGDTIEIFSRHYTMRNIIAFEPDTITFTSLRHNLSNMKIPCTIITIQGAVGKENNILTFDSVQDGSASISEKGNTQVPVFSLDALLANCPVDFIKMDIEGGERNALEGASKIIHQQQPMLATSIYHSITDFFDIPQLIYQLNPQYKLFLRCHNDCFHDAVCYAVPTRFLRNAEKQNSK